MKQVVLVGSGKNTMVKVKKVAQKVHFLSYRGDISSIFCREEGEVYDCCLARISLKEFIYRF